VIAVYRDPKKSDNYTMSFNLDSKAFKTEEKHPPKEPGFAPLSYSVIMGSNKCHEQSSGGFNMLIQEFGLNLNPADFPCVCANIIEFDDKGPKPPKEMGEKILFGVDRFEVFIVNDK